MPAVLPDVEAWLGKAGRLDGPLVLTGHSLGGALATLAASVLRPDLLVTLGSPRVGDAAFAATLDGIRIVRLKHCADLVTTVPPTALGYQHVGERLYIDASGTVQADATDARIRADVVTAEALYLVGPALAAGNVKLRGLADHAPINYLRAFF